MSNNDDKQFDEQTTDESQESTHYTRRTEPHRYAKETLNAKSHKKHKKPRRWAWLLIILLLVVVGFGAFAAQRIFQFGNNIYQRAEANRLRDANEQLSNGEPITILVEGLDNGALFYKDNEDARSDVIVLIAINPKTNESLMVNVPRDTLVPMGQTDEFDKVNHAYMNGGIGDSIDSLQRYLDVPIDYYVTVNMQAFIDVIDSIGGVELTPSITFEQDGSEFVEGQTETFNGVDAINYVRMRKQDPEGDIGRGKREQEVLQAVINKAVSWDTITNYDQILEKLEGNLYTNLRVPDMIQLQSNYMEAIRQPEHQVMDNFQDRNLSFGYYLFVPETERLQISNDLRKVLGLPKSESAVIYPPEYEIYNEEYVTAVDSNGDGEITSDEMPVSPGVYQLEQLKKKYEMEDIELDLSWREDDAQEAENE